MARVSLCVMTAGPVDRVAALVEVVRPHVDEVVLAIDARADATTRDRLAGLADRALVVPTSSVVEALPWVFSSCRSEWILRLDDDEVPSRRFLDDLDELTSSGHRVAVGLRRHWLYERPDRRIVTRPWAPDFQLRLVRNLPGLWRFSGLVHDGLQITGPRHFAAAGMYHLDLLLQPVDRRRAKRDAYEARRPGLFNDGFPVNDVYVPEEHDVVTEAVPAEDRPLIEALLAGRRAAVQPSTAPEALDPTRWPRMVGTRDPLPSIYDGSCRAVDLPARLPAGGVVHVEVEVVNRGAEWWGADSAPPVVHVGARWFDPTGQPIGDESRAALPEAVRPGCDGRLLLGLRVPAARGPMDVEIDLVHEHVRWFGVGDRHRVAVDD